VVGVGVGYIGKNNTTTGCALGACRLQIEEEEGLEAWRLTLGAARLAHIQPQVVFYFTT